MDGSLQRLVIMCFLSFIFLVTEFTFGLLTGSLALLVDAFHMLSDQITFIIGIISIRAGKKKSTDLYSYGWKRAEIIGALVNAIFLISLCFFIILEAIQRFIQKPTIQNPTWILVVGSAGLGLNILGLIIFSGGSSMGHSHGHQHGHSHDSEKKNISGRLNLHGIFLHVLGDALGSIGAMITGLGIWLLKWSWRFYLDPLCSILISFIILFSSFPLAMRTIRILMQRVPSNIDLSLVRKDLLSLNADMRIHELHVWQLADTKIIGTVHMMCPSNVDFLVLASNMKGVLHSHGIHATTIQPEFFDPSLIQKNTTDACALLCKEPECENSFCCETDSLMKFEDEKGK